MQKKRHKFSHELHSARKIALDVGELVLDYFNNKNYAIKHKNGDLSNFVTNVDKEAEKQIIDELQRIFPSHGFVGEESHNDKKLKHEHVWIIDPLDNTKGFIGDSGDFSIQIALSSQGKVKLGVVHFPKLKLTYYAEKGKGAWLNGKKIETSKNKNFQDMRALMSRRVTTDERLKEIYDKITCKSKAKLGGAGRKICLTAQGDSELVFYKENSAKEWDFAAPGIVLEEAGGNITLLDGSPLEYNKGNPAFDQPIIISNGMLHNEVLENLRK